MSELKLNELSEAVADLQARYAFQEDHVQALNNTVAEQQQTIARLLKVVKEQSDILGQIQGQQGGGGGADLMSDRPPHY